MVVNVLDPHFEAIKAATPQWMLSTRKPSKCFHGNSCPFRQKSTCEVRHQCRVRRPDAKSVLIPSIDVQYIYLTSSTLNSRHSILKLLPKVYSAKMSSYPVTLKRPITVNKGLGPNPDSLPPKARFGHQTARSWSGIEECVSTAPESSNGLLHTTSAGPCHCTWRCEAFMQLLREENPFHEAPDSQFTWCRCSKRQFGNCVVYCFVSELSFLLIYGRAIDAFD